MNFATTHVKRPVPRGAKDLEIYDEQHYWQCRRCNAISTECLSRCECGELAIDFPAFGRAEGHREIPTQTIVENHEAGLYGYFCDYRNYAEDIFGYKCISCARCNYCAKELKTTRFVRTGIYSEGNKTEVEYKVYHEDCFSLKQKTDERNKQSAERLKLQNRQEARNREASKRATRQVIKAVVWAIIVYPIVGFGGCAVRQFNSMNALTARYNNDRNYNRFASEWWETGFVAYREEAIYASLIVLAIGILLAILTKVSARSR